MNRIITLLSCLFLLFSIKTKAQCSTTPAQVSDITLSVNAGSLSVNWNEVSADTRYLVIGREASETTFTPLNGTTYTTGANLNFMAATTLGGDNSKLLANTSNESVNISGLEEGKTYHITIFAFCNNGKLYNTNITNEANSDSILFTINYCSISSNSASDTDINSISTDGFSNSDAGGTESTEYYDNTNLSPIEIFRDTVFDLDLNVSSSSTEASQVIVWIDFNRDGDFNDSSESIDFGEISANTTSTLTQAIEVPVNATLGTTRLRVVIKEGTSDPSNCGNQNGIEVEDYSININTINTSDVLNISNNSTSNTITANEQTVDFGGIDSGVGFESIFFEIKDDSNFPDGKNTEVSQMTLREGNNNTFNWDGLDLNKVVITYSDNSDFTSASTLILTSAEVTQTANSLSLDLSSSTINILDNTSKYFKINLFLDETLPVDSDQSLFQAEVTYNNLGFSTTTGSNGFLSEINSGNDILGPELTINVEASQLIFTNTFLSDYFVNINFETITVQAKDINGNLDTDYSNEITLSSDDLNGIDISVDATNSVLAENGEANFNAIFYDEIATAETLQATDGTLTSNSSSSFNVIETDADTQIESPTAQILPSTVIAADHTSSGTPIEVFRFDIEDLGTSDGLSTFVTEIKFTSADNNTANFQDVINNISLSDGTQTYIADSFTTTQDTITLSFAATPIEVNDASTLTLTASVELSNNPIVDNSIIALEIDTSNHEFSSTNQGSNFEENQSNGIITGPEITLNVVATELIFSKQPSNTLIGQTIVPAVEVAAVDINNNLDTDYSQDITLTPSGVSTISLSSILTEQAASGIATFDDLSYSSIGIDNSLSAEDNSAPTSLVSGTSNLFEILGTFDETSLVNTPVSQSTNQIIEAASFTDASSTFEVFSFSLNDTGPDGLSTNVTRVSFTPSTENTADWSDHISGLVLSDGTTTYTPDSSTITDTEITLVFNTPIIIEDSSSLELKVNAFLNTTNIVDGAIISFEILTSNTAFSANTSGSRFNSPYVTETITGPEITIDVVGTELAFSSQPTNTLIFQNMSTVEVSLSDVNGNEDTTSTIQVNITSTGSLVGGTTSSQTSNAFASFGDIVHDATGTGLTLTANATGFTSITSTSFDITDEEVIALQDWDDTTPVWTINSVSSLTNAGWDINYFGEINTSNVNVNEFSNTLFSGEIFGINNLLAITGASNPELIELVNVDVSNYNDISFSFDYEYLNLDDAVDVLSYELFYDDVSQGEVSLLSTGTDQDLSGNINLSIDESGGEISNIRVTLKVFNNSLDEYIGIDNISLLGKKASIDYVYDGTSWSPENPDGIATIQDNLTVESGTTSLNSINFCNNLQIDAGATLNLNAATTFSGDIINDGELNATDADLEFKGSTAQNLTSSTKINVKSIKLSNSNNLTLDTDIDLFETLTIDAGNINITTNDTLTLRSNALGTASIGQIANGSSISGGIIIEQFIPQSNRAFRYLSSPISTTTSINDNWQEGQNNNSGEISNYNENWNDYVANGHNNNNNPGFGTHITGSNTGSDGFDETLTGNSSIFSWDNSFQQWNSISNTQSNSLIAGNAYTVLIRGDRSTSLFSNSVVGGATTLRIKDNAENLVYGNTNVNSNLLNSEAIGSWNLIGNLYQAKVDMQQLTNNSTDIQTNYYYVYDPTLNQRGGYVAVDLNTINGSPTPSSNQDKYLQPGQAFFIQNTGISPQLSFQENYKKAGQVTNVVLNTSNNTDFKEVNIEVFKNQTLVDGAKVEFGSQYSDEVNFEDALKLWNNDESLAIKNNEDYLSIDKRNTLNQDTEINLFLWNFTSTNYIFKINITNVENAILYDQYLETYTALESGQNSIDVEIDEAITESIDSNRFKIIFDPTTLNFENFEDSIEALSIYPNPNSGKLINIKGNYDFENIKVNIYDQFGRLINSPSIKQQQIDLETALNPGIYFIEFNNGDIKSTKKLIVK
ncbi:T9SS type A sorting domain-containing protein [Psychroflexus sp. ALD_RP9]|uniref:T9SS type A sorting domain-containing protein n=1 Tax=Psychroflexus sp. ALD_RP9 TaxID=2777186 RepID=UPI001A8EB6C0|nr:T9SS type A sorting domain-containing protein [Psychroflexus sp. ALD_RP9]QSS97404.1 T9SS type A sorting domain-containing protein [Psychroflexus sp. ALD_RP9]